MKVFRKKAFTLIELLTVIAVIAILSGILIPVTGGVIKQARIAASKAQLWQYVTAIESFKTEYNYYPQVYDNDGLIDLTEVARSEDFIESLSGKDHSTPASYGDPISNGGNYRKIEFHSFSQSEFFVKSDGTISPNELADSFNSKQIYMLVDVDGDGRIKPNVNSTPLDWMRSSVTAWVNEDSTNNNPSYTLWD